MRDVLSFPVRCGGFCDNTRNRVKLLRLSSIRDLMTFKPYNCAASSEAMAAMDGSSRHISAARAVLATSETGTCGILVSSQLRHCAIAGRWEQIFLTSSAAPDFDMRWCDTSCKTSA